MPYQQIETVPYDSHQEHLWDDYEAEQLKYEAQPVECELNFED